MNSRRISIARVLGIALCAVGINRYSSAADKLPRVGALLPRSDVEVYLREELALLGYREGGTVTFDWRRYNDWGAEMRTMAVNLAVSPVDLIIAYGTPAARAVMDATRTTPIVFAVGDPLASGLVSSLSRPGQNATGVSVVSTEVSEKLLDLMIQLVPHGRRFITIRNPSNATSIKAIEQLQTLGTQRQVRLTIVEATNVRELEQGLSNITRRTADAILVPADLILLAEKERTLRAVRATSLPAVFQDEQFARGGGLMSYAPSQREIAQRVAGIAKKVLDGARPAEVPVEQVTRLTLILNTRTAKELGIAVPETILARADELVQ